MSFFGLHGFRQLPKVSVHQLDAAPGRQSSAQLDVQGYRSEDVVVRLCQYFPRLDMCAGISVLYSCILAFNFHGDVLVLLVALCALTYRIRVCDVVIETTNT